MVSTAFLLGIVPALLLLKLFGRTDLLGSAASVFLVVSLVLALLQHYAFYNLIRCPMCSYNPTKFKNGKNMPVKTAWSKLRAYEVCPNCTAGGGCLTNQTLQPTPKGGAAVLFVSASAYPRYPQIKLFRNNKALDTRA
jgi:rubredoxin